MTETEKEFLEAEYDKANAERNHSRATAVLRVLAEKASQVELQVFPAGLQWVQPIAGEGPCWIHILIDPLTVKSLERQRQQIIAAGEIPYFDIEHRDKEVAFLPKRFFWRDGIVGGVYAVGQLK